MVDGSGYMHVFIIKTYLAAEAAILDTSHPLGHLFIVPSQKMLMFILQCPPVLETGDEVVLFPMKDDRVTSVTEGLRLGLEGRDEGPD